MSATEKEKELQVPLSPYSIWHSVLQLGKKMVLIMAVMKFSKQIVTVVPSPAAAKKINHNLPLHRINHNIYICCYDCNPVVPAVSRPICSIYNFYKEFFTSQRFSECTIF